MTPLLFSTSTELRYHYSVGLFFSWRGRANRAGFWLISLVWTVLATAAHALGLHLDAECAWFAQGWLTDIFTLLGALICVASCLAVCVRRMHDRNMSAWWLFVYVVLPILMQTGAQLDNLDAGPAVLLIGAAAIELWAFVDLGVLRGTEGTNRYGPDPLNGEARFT